MDQREIWHPGYRHKSASRQGATFQFFRLSPFEGLHGRLGLLYQSNPDNATGVALGAKGEKIPAFSVRIWNAAVNHIRKHGTYSAKMLKDKPVKAVIGETQRILDDGLQSGLSDNEPPVEMTDSLKSDVFVFSACKTHIQLKELSSLLLDKEGKVTPISTFKQKATELHQQYNQNYLEAEYIFATASAQMAAQWADVAQSENRYDLQYRTAGDNRVRDSHRRLSDITLPADDPFWDHYYPPNGWRCRCTAVQVLKGKYAQSDSDRAITLGEVATTEIDAQGNNRAEMFRFNPGKEKVIFPPSHPYYKVQKIVDKNIQE